MATRTIAVWSCILFRTTDKQYILGALYGYANLSEAEAAGQIVAELTERGLIATHIVQRGTVRREGIAETSFR